MPNDEQLPDDETNYPSAQQVQQYVEAANACLQGGLDDPDCKKAKALEAAAIAAGADPGMVETISTCMQDRGSDECAKAAAKIGAVAACTTATEGVGASLCAKVAPVVVDLVWPFVGPIVGPVWGWGVDLGAAVADFMSGVGEAILGSLGIDLGTTADPTVTDVYWDIKGSIESQLHAAYDQSLEALIVARDQSAKQLDLDTVWEQPNQIRESGTGELRVATPSDRLSIEGYDAEADAAMERELEFWLAREPAWSSSFKVERKTERFGHEVRRFVEFGAKPANVSTSFGPNWRPSNFAYFEDGWGWGNDRKALAAAAAEGMARRAQGLSRATTRAIGSVVQKQTMRANAGRLNQLGAGDSGSSTLLVLATLAALVGGGYWLWAKKKRT
jgi:hypothetical protein